jgi:hypothetical protein
MSKPNAEQFAKGVLYSLAAIRADLTLLRNEMYRQLAKEHGEAYEEVAIRYEKQRDKILAVSFSEALRDIGLPDKAGPFEPPHSASRDDA